MALFNLGLQPMRRAHEWISSIASPPRQSEFLAIEKLPKSENEKQPQKHRNKIQGKQILRYKPTECKRKKGEEEEEGK